MEWNESWNVVKNIYYNKLHCCLFIHFISSQNIHIYSISMYWNLLPASLAFAFALALTFFYMHTLPIQQCIVSILWLQTVHERRKNAHILIVIRKLLIEFSQCKLKMCHLKILANVSAAAAVAVDVVHFFVIMDCTH